MEINSGDGFRNIRQLIFWQLNSFRFLTVAVHNGLRFNRLGLIER